MQKLVEAERNKRADILRSEGIRESAINEAEGERKAKILSSEASKIGLINIAEGEAAAMRVNAEAKVNNTLFSYIQLHYYYRKFGLIGKM